MPVRGGRDGRSSPNCSLDIRRQHAGRRSGSAHDRALALWTEHDRRARDLLRLHHGREIDRADGFLLMFDTAADAARYALDYHAALAELGLAARLVCMLGRSSCGRSPRRHRAGRQAGRSRRPGKAARRESDGDGTGRADVAQRGGPAGARRGRARHRGRRSRSHGHYRLKGIEEPVEVFELGTALALQLHPAGRRRQVVPRRAQRRSVAAGARDPAPICRQNATPSSVVAPTCRRSHAISTPARGL